MEPPTNHYDLQDWNIERVLSQEGGNRTRAAKILGISVKTLRRRIKEIGLPNASRQFCPSSEKQSG